MKKDDFRIYDGGLCDLSVCTSLKDIVDIQKEANAKVPTGTSSKWRMSEDKTFSNGKTNPHKCEHRKGYKHYLLDYYPARIISPFDLGLYT